MNTNAQPDREKEIFEQAVEITSPEERHAFLKLACAGDDVLRIRLETLLEAHADASQFLGEKPAARGSLGLTVPDEEKVGACIGRYKLLEKIGEGGFGVVYVAEQREPVKRRVALKIIKLGMDTKEVVARFEAERQALAMMDHSNIAKVLDAGATGSGRPYFVMELVRGLRITDYCDQNQLGMNDRLKLFILVCHAVQHAHQKGIIHRDLKPSNILVTLHDGAPVPKVIDFGIAKATQQELTAGTVYTQLRQFIGTPAYMSPEQAEMSGLDIDTRADIYSLGVLLYEVLTGQTPFDVCELLKAGVDELRRTIREQEPLRPSTKLNTLQHADLTTAAKRRGSDAPKLVNLLRGDLDWIVMKCLEKDRARRYETANGLAADLQRYLGNEPVVACPPSAAYRFQKLVRRNRLAFAAGAAIAAALVLGVMMTTWQAVRATRAEREQSRLRARAEAEAAKREQVARFLGEIATGGSAEVASGSDPALLREILDKAATRLQGDNQGGPEPAYNLSLAYDGLHEYSKAEVWSREALALARQAHGDDSARLQEYIDQLTDLLLRQGKYAEAERVFSEALAWGARSSQNTTRLLGARGYLHARLGKWPEAALDMRKALELDPKNHEYYHWLAALLVQSGDTEGYFKHRQAQLATFAGTDNPTVAERMTKSCLILPLPDAGIEVVRRWAETALAAGTNHSARTWFELAHGLAEYRQGNFAAVERWMERVLREAGVEPNRDVEASMVLALAQHQLGRRAAAKAALARGSQIAATQLPKPGSTDLGATWVDWAIAQALMREARGLIEDERPVGKENK